MQAFLVTEASSHAWSQIFKILSYGLNWVFVTCNWRIPAVPNTLPLSVDPAWGDGARDLPPPWYLPQGHPSRVCLEETWRPIPGLPLALFLCLISWSKEIILNMALVSSSTPSPPKYSEWQETKSKGWGLLMDTYKTQDRKEEEWDSWEDEQPAPAQAGHHKHSQDDLEHCPDGPEHLAGENGGQSRCSSGPHSVQFQGRCRQGSPRGCEDPWGQEGKNGRPFSCGPYGWARASTLSNSWGCHPHYNICMAPTGVCTVAALVTEIKTINIVWGQQRSGHIGFCLLIFTFLAQECPGLLYQNCHSRGAEHFLSASLSHSMLFHLALCMDLIHRLPVLWLYIGCSQWGNPIGDERKDRWGCLFQQDGHGLAAPFSWRFSERTGSRQWGPLRVQNQQQMHFSI